ncbi:MAG: alcohol dehydrogenase catalytic domain-containing protein [Acidobacteriota bacterium]|nr:alcohol dehydrogenase catalytic domain-containing protein [Acidobacteriota bacterium]
MKAARVVDRTVRIVEVELPEPGPEDALIRITAAGVCHSDLHLARGDWAGVGQSGLLGHEAIGVVEALGADAGQWVSVGDRVILGLGGTGGGYWCGACHYCLTGKPRHCAQSRGIMGTFAEHFSVWAKSLVVIPDGLSDLEAPLACGGLTAFGAVRKLLDHGVRPGRPVAVIGAAGGLGHYAVQMCAGFGYDVVAVDRGEERLEFTRTLGARLALDAGQAGDAVKATGGVDAALVFTANLAGFDLGLEMLGKAGLFVAVGLPPSSDGPIRINPFTFFFKDPTLVYSAVGTVEDMRELVDLAAAGKVRSHVDRTGRLSELEAIFDDLHHSRYLGRAVVTDLAN